jgi:imidazolonepropionase-like amidohydrolase
MRKLLSLYILLCLAVATRAQETLPRNDVKDERAGAYAFVGATIVADYQTVIPNGLLLIREGKVEYVGNTKPIPSGYTSIDVAGKHIYPSFIDMYTNYGIPKDKPAVRGNRFGGREQIQSKTKGAYNGNEAIKAEYSAANNFSIDKKEAKALREIGFGSVLSYRADGIARGTSALVTLRDDADNKAMLNEHAAAHYSFNRGTSRQNYPRSAMGFIALLRQTYLDAQWYGAQNPRPYKDISLEHWLLSQSLPQIFDTRDWLSSLRADKIGDEFGVQYIIKGGGNEYQRIKEIKATGANFIIPVNFPDAYDVDDPFDAEKVSLKDMKHWELAPANLAVLSQNGVSFALTTADLKKKISFWPNLRKAINNGLPEQEALKALTYTPAKLLGADHEIGSLSTGKLANFIITSDNVFAKKSVIQENWVQGVRYPVKDLKEKDNSGKYELKVGTVSYTVEISGKPGEQKAKIMVNDSTTIKVTAKFDANLVTLIFSPDKEEGLVRLSGWQQGTGWQGQGQQVDGTWVAWSLIRTGDIDQKKDKEEQQEEPDTVSLGEVIYPFVAYGNTKLPQQQTILIKNATLWTNEDEGVIESTDILLKEGKISAIGKNLSGAGAYIIDGTGKHVTSGIIDEHSHVGASAINDWATNSGMVRIGDVLNPEQVNIYRALSGGVTAIQVLHGSANPIGGQSALIKLRWGAAPEEMKIAGADGFIKFALGENVKRSRSQSSIRYPQTRMGVEQVYMDAFSSAKEYEQRWNTYNSLSKKVRVGALAPRRDLADETMLEIINGERFITCHSYVQSEINMLMNVADKFDFKVNTFTHILEGYKVADRMKAHGVGASTFSDWWNYKWEVRYAIPYNAAIMHREGIVVAINSDDANRLRRLNLEAAKSIKYGDLSEQEVWQMVTLNPAKLLHLDHRMGSLKVGKDADIVVWNDHPLSVYAKAETTIVDGTIYYDLKQDQEKRSYILAERGRLIQKMKAAKANGGKTQKAFSKLEVEFHCEDEQLDTNLFD